MTSSNLVEKAFESLKEAVKNDVNNYIKEVAGIFWIRVINTDGTVNDYIVDTRDETVRVSDKKDFVQEKKHDVLFELKEIYIDDLIQGKLDPQKAFFQGKIKIKGDMGLAFRLAKIRNQLNMEKRKAKL